MEVHRDIMPRNVVLQMQRGRCKRWDALSPSSKFDNNHKWVAVDFSCWQKLTWTLVKICKHVQTSARLLTSALRFEELRVYRKKAHTQKRWLWFRFVVKLNATKSASMWSIFSRVSTNCSGPCALQVPRPYKSIQFTIYLHPVQRVRFTCREQANQGNPRRALRCTERLYSAQQIICLLSIHAFHGCNVIVKFWHLFLLFPKKLKQDGLPAFSSF